MSEIRIFYNGVSRSQQTILTSHKVLHCVTSSGSPRKTNLNTGDGLRLIMH
jgi:hypothetical protein